MKAFVSVGTKFTSHSMTWIARQQTRKGQGTGFDIMKQIWTSKKTWLHLTCRYDVNREKLSWDVGRYDTASTRSGAASLAASLTREALDQYVDRLATYGDGVEARYSKMILKKKNHTVCASNLFKGEVQW